MKDNEKRGIDLPEWNVEIDFDGKIYRELACNGCHTPLSIDNEFTLRDIIECEGGIYCCNKCLVLYGHNEITDSSIVRFMDGTEMTFGELTRQREEYRKEINRNGGIGFATRGFGHKNFKFYKEDEDEED